MLSLVPAVIGIVATAILAAGAVYARALTPAAGAVATLFGAIIVVFIGFPYLALLILFVAASSLATRYRFEEKRQQKLQEGASGERGVSNVLAHILLPTAIAIPGGLNPPLLPPATVSIIFTAALAFGASDTFASEFGVLAGKARSILTFREVPPGTNGGISALGEAFAFAGAALTGVIGAGLLELFGDPPLDSPIFLVIVVVAGFLACQIDSVLGETLENRGYLTKGSTNFFGMLSAVAIGVGLLAATGGPL